VGQPQFLALLAEAYGKIGQVEAGLASITEALAAAHKSGELYYEPELHRLKGQFLLLLSPENYEEAESAFRQAITVARRQQARWWELRAAASLYQLLEPQNREEEAHRLLAACYHRFTEGFDTADLTAARQLLASQANSRH
jgi:predicted ATPase